MRVLRIVLVVVLLGVGVGAVVIVVGGLPTGGSSASAQLISSAVTTRTITQSAAATGNVSAANVVMPFSRAMPARCSSRSVARSIPCRGN